MVASELTSQADIILTHAFDVAMNYGWIQFVKVGKPVCDFCHLKLESRTRFEAADIGIGIPGLISD